MLPRGCFLRAWHACRGLARYHAASRRHGENSAAGQTALALWEEVRCGDDPLDAAAFNAAASAYVATGQIQRVYDLIRDMQGRDLSPGVRM